MIVIYHLYFIRDSEVDEGACLRSEAEKHLSASIQQV